MSLTIKGVTSGSVDVVAPASGSDVTLTLPTTTATVATLASPVFTGNVGIGGSSANGILYVTGASGTNNQAIRAFNTSSDGHGLYLNLDSNSSNTYGIRVDNSTGEIFKLETSGTVGIGATATTAVGFAAPYLCVTAVNASLGLKATSGAHWELASIANGNLRIIRDDVDQMMIDASGRVTMPNQPAFSANMVSGGQNNFGGGEIIIQFGREHWDVGGNFNTSTYTFTAPVTGKYILSASVHLQSMSTGGNQYYKLMIDTSNRTYYNYMDPEGLSTDGMWTMTLTHVADMDANDTAICRIKELAQGGTTDIVADVTHWTGYLLG
jgi:hypothetical protein